ncbi:MAG: hypothetical protein Q4G49_10900 [Paracoccus sp. (in: a-proteobacteria)]|nr:hypothetical protein [Paracoccus sp. (in: a-proteobacteria)]
MTDRENPEITMKRIEALAMMAGVNASNSGGDHATAAADLLCAFVLMAMRAGADPIEAREAMERHAIVACEDFWGRSGRRADA